MNGKKVKMKNGKKKNGKLNLNYTLYIFLLSKLLFRKIFGVFAF